MKNPDAAPAHFRDRVEAAERVSAERAATGKGGRAAGRFNLDGLGLPQNEESISACRQDPRLVLGSTNRLALAGARPWTEHQARSSSGCHSS
jgi:hypothetical protein